MSILQRIEEAEDRVRLSGDAFELGQCRAARKALEYGDIMRAQDILHTLEAPVAESALEEYEDRFSKPLVKMFGGLY